MKPAAHAHARHRLYAWTVFIGGMTLLLALTGRHDAPGHVRSTPTSYAVLWAAMILGRRDVAAAPCRRGSRDLEPDDRARPGGARPVRPALASLGGRRSRAARRTRRSAGIRSCPADLAGPDRARDRRRGLVYTTLGGASASASRRARSSAAARRGRHVLSRVKRARWATPAQALAARRRRRRGRSAPGSRAPAGRPRPPAVRHRCSRSPRCASGRSASRCSSCRCCSRATSINLWARRKRGAPSTGAHADVGGRRGRSVHARPLVSHLAMSAARRPAPRPARTRARGARVRRAPARHRAHRDPARHR